MEIACELRRRSDPNSRAESLYSDRCNRAQIRIVANFSIPAHADRPRSKSTIQILSGASREYCAHSDRHGMHRRREIAASVSHRCVRRAVVDTGIHSASRPIPPAFVAPVDTPSDQIRAINDAATFETVRLSAPGHREDRHVAQFRQRECGIPRNPRECGRHACPYIYICEPSRLAIMPPRRKVPDHRTHQTAPRRNVTLPRPPRTSSANAAAPANGAASNQAASNSVRAGLCKHGGVEQNRTA